MAARLKGKDRGEMSDSGHCPPDKNERRPSTEKSTAGIFSKRGEDLQNTPQGRPPRGSSPVRKPLATRDLSQLQDDPFSTPPYPPNRSAQSGTWEDRFQTDPAEPSLVDISFATSTPDPRLTSRTDRAEPSLMDISFDSSTPDLRLLRRTDRPEHSLMDISFDTSTPDPQLTRRERPARFQSDRAEPSLVDISFDASTPEPWLTNRRKPKEDSGPRGDQAPSPLANSSNGSSALWHQLNITGESLLTDVEQPWLVDFTLSPTPPSTPQERQTTGTAPSPVLVCMDDPGDLDAASDTENKH